MNFEGVGFYSRVGLYSSRYSIFDNHSDGNDYRDLTSILKLWVPYIVAAPKCSTCNHGCRFVYGCGSTFTDPTVHCLESTHFTSRTGGGLLSQLYPRDFK